MPTPAFSKKEVPLPSSSQGLWYCPLMQRQTQCAHYSGIKRTPSTLLLRSARSDWPWDGHRQRDRPLPGKEGRKEGSGGETSFFCQLTAIKSIPLCNFPQPAPVRWGLTGAHQGAGAGSRSSPSSFLLLPVLKKEKLKIYFPCRNIWVKENKSFQKHFLNKSDIFFSFKMPSLGLFSKPAC